MIWFLIIFGYILMMVVSGVIITNIDDDFKTVEGGVFAFLLFLCAIWPLTLTGYTTHGIINIPKKRRERKQARRQAAYEEELAAEKHRTELAKEHAKHAKAKEQEYRALGLGTFPEP